MQERVFRPRHAGNERLIIVKFAAWTMDHGAARKVQAEGKLTDDDLDVITVVGTNWRKHSGTLWLCEKIKWRRDVDDWYTVRGGAALLP